MFKGRDAVCTAGCKFGVRGSGIGVTECILFRLARRNTSTVPLGRRSIVSLSRHFVPSYYQASLQDKMHCLRTRNCERRRVLAPLWGASRYGVGSQGSAGLHPGLSPIGPPGRRMGFLRSVSRSERRTSNPELRTSNFELRTPNAERRHADTTPHPFVAGPPHYDIFAPMRIGLDVAQTCVERHGCGWVADRIATAIGNICSDDEIILYHQFGEWLNWRTAEGTMVERSNVSAPFMGSSWLSASIAWKQIQSGSRNLPDDPEIVQSFSFQAPSVGDAKLVYTVYDLSFWTHPEFSTEANRLSCQTGLLNALRRASALVFISENSRNDFESLLNCSDRVRALPAAVVPLASRFPPITGPRAGYSHGTWLSVGAMEPRKNIDLLLDAFEIYQSLSGIKRKLCLAGGKGWKSECTWKRIADLRRHGVVEHRGYVSDSELVRLYNKAFGFVFPSHYEGFGLPVLESMSQACPVICSKNSSLPEVGGEAVIYWDGESAESLAGSMLRLEQDESLYQQLSKSGWDRAQTFSWEKTARELRTFYDRVRGD